MKKKVFNYFLVCLIMLIPFIEGSSQAIIADHSVVASYKDIPQTYIDKVKQMWVIYAGESHSFGIRRGAMLLKNIDPVFNVNIVESGVPESYTDQYLRLSRATWGDVSSTSGWIYSYGEEDWFTSANAISHTKAHLTYCNTHNYEVAAMGFGWCWDMTEDNGPTAVKDPVYNVGWAGRTSGGPEGSKSWGLDAADFSITSNSVCMDTYLKATVDYITHCVNNGYSTKIFFTTGPVDGTSNIGEKGYQRSLKHNYIRDYVNASSNYLLFDYADILCWNNNGEQNQISWTDASNQTHSFQFIHPDNMKDQNGSYSEDGDHIGEVGAIRLAKAFWWMLARIAGWNGVVTDVEDTSPVDNQFDFQTKLIGNELFIKTTDKYLNGQAYLFNLSGFLLQKKDIKDYDFFFNVGSYPSGLYFVKLVESSFSSTEKVILVK